MESEGRMTKMYVELPKESKDLFVPPLQVVYSFAFNQPLLLIASIWVGTERLNTVKKFTLK